jgi:hypothetical protein
MMKSNSVGDAAGQVCIGREVGEAAQAEQDSQHVMNEFDYVYMWRCVGMQLDEFALTEKSNTDHKRC